MYPHVSTDCISCVACGADNKQQLFYKTFIVMENRCVFCSVATLFTLLLPRASNKTCFKIPGKKLRICSTPQASCFLHFQPGTCTVSTYLKLTIKIQHSWSQCYIQAHHLSITKLITKCDLITLSWAAVGLHHKS